MPLSGRGARSSSNTMSLGSMPTFLPSGILIHQAIWPQQIWAENWGTPSNFNGFLVLAALLHGTLLLGVSQTAALNRGRHLYSTRRPPRWALAHILVFPRLSQQWEIGRPPYFRTWCGLSANLECRSEMCCMQLAVNTGCKNRHLGTIAQLCRAISPQLSHISTIGK